jgi:hypothetical protein
LDEGAVEVEAVEDHAGVECLKSGLRVGSFNLDDRSKSVEALEADRRGLEALVS